MATLADVLTALPKLQLEELALVREAIDRLEQQARTIVLNPSAGPTFRLCRLSDKAYRELWPRTVALDHDDGFFLELFWSLRDRHEERLQFVHIYLALKHLSGESSEHLDPYKMAFSFPFALDVVKKAETVAYLLDVHNLRGSLCFSLRKVVAPDDPRLKTRLLYQPFEDFSRKEIRFFYSYLYGYLQGVWEWLQHLPQQPFVRRICSNRLIFGYVNGQTFEEDYDSEEAFEAAWQHYEQLVKQESQVPQPPSSKDD